MHIFTPAASDSCSNPHVLPCTLRFSARLFLASAKIYTFFKAFLSTFCFSLLVTHSAVAQEKYFEEIEGYKVYYSVFSSTSISAEIAERYGLVRGKDRVFVNIAVVPKDEQFGGVKADVSGAAANLMQQQKSLTFQEIEEPNAVYYLAALRHTNREVFNFVINVDPQGSAGPFEVTFSKTLYVNP